MSQPFRRIRYIEYLVTLAAAILLVTACAVDLYFPQTYAGLTRPAATTGLVLGLLLILLHVLKILKAFRRDVGNFIILKSETGSVRVHVSTVEEALRRAARTLPEIHDIKISLLIDRESSIPSSGVIDAWLNDVTNILGIHESLARVLAERYEQIIPNAPPVDFHVTIKHQFRPLDKPPKPDRKHRRDDEDPQAVRAPRYPVPK